MVLFALLVAGCSLKTSMGGSSTGPSSPSPASSSSSSDAPAGNPSDRIVMPDLTGKTVDEATAALRAAGFTREPEVNRRALECEGAARVAGKINCQDPEPGKTAMRSAIISVNVHEERRIEGALVRAQLVKARGMTVADAKKYLKGLGHTGDVRVFVLHSWASDCGGVDKVCSVEPESGTSMDGHLTINVNPGSAEDPNRGPTD